MRHKMAVQFPAFRFEPEAGRSGFQCMPEDFMQPLRFAETGLNGNAFYL